MSHMGLLYTKLYLDFDSEEWQQTSNDPVMFKARKKDIFLDIEDTSHKTHRLVFKQGGAVGVLRVSGRFRITWDEDDIVL